MSTFRPFISKKNKICYNTSARFAYHSKDGRGYNPVKGPQNVILALPHPEIAGEYIARSGANAHTVEAAAEQLKLVIHYPTRKHPDREFNYK